VTKILVTNTLPPKLTPTAEQQAIIDAARSGDNLVVVAGAGSGKTSTQRMVSRSLPTKRGIYIAYNRAIADDARGSFPTNTQCSTAHSLAWRVIGKDYQHRLTGERVTARMTAERLGIRGFVVDADDLAPEKYPQTPLLPKHIAMIMGDTIQNFCWSADDEITKQHVPWETKLSRQQMNRVADEILPYARAAWNDIQDHYGRLRFTHDYYLKMWQLTHPRLECDFVLLDEAQDANPCIAAVVNDQDHAQKILVGDPAQQIYAWRGAVDAMDGFDGRRLTLSQSFRFGQAIAEEANLWLETL
jgi:AAA domain